MKEYRVIKRFTVTDIYRLRPVLIKAFRKKEEVDFEEWFFNLLQGETGGWEDINDVLDSDVLCKHFDWLEGKGFIKEKIDPLLRIGMKVIGNNNEYKLITDGCNDFFYFLIDDTCWEYDRKVKVGMHLSDLNRVSDPTKYEVVND